MKIFKYCLGAFIAIFILTTGQQLRPPDDPSPSLDSLKEWKPASLGYIERLLKNQREIIRLREQILR